MNNHSSPAEFSSNEEAVLKKTPNIRHDWYQTQAMVIINILVKGVKEDDLNVNINENNLDVTINLHTSELYQLNLTLCQEVVPDQCQTRVLSSKVEIKLKKKYGYHWPTLEADPSQINIQNISISEPTESHTSKLYPSSNKNPRDWDKIVYDIKEEEKTEEPEGDEALNKLFQKIYADGTDEQKKAMNKSFTESGGTVLSTNWNEIGDRKTEVKPPDGMEFKKWEK